MKTKGYIEVTVIPSGLEAPNIRQSIRVEDIKLVTDGSRLTAGDKERLQWEPQTNTVLSIPALAAQPAEVEETYEQIMALIKEASE